ncbi:MAG: hypothetical protein VX519_07020 [Myxococcota bacterium]|nr:hypothetical protein [Myxococcota bacterium]
MPISSQLLLISLTTSALLLGCSGKSDTPPPKNTDPTWHQDIAPFVAQRCSSCHNDDDDFAFDLSDYETVKPLASWMLTKMHGDSTPPYVMPPFGARDTEECTPPAPWRDDPRPTDAELALFEEWIEADTPEGDPDTAASLPTPETESLSGDNIETYTIAGASLEEGDLEDQYLCFPIPLGHTVESWITGLEVLPDNKDITHHAVVFTDPNGEATDMAGDDGSYDCFGSAGVSDTTVLFAWAPGGQPLDLGQHMGAHIPVGGQLVLQMHYHPTGSAAEDASQLAVRMTDTQPEKTAEMRVFGGILPDHTNSNKWEDPPFEVPAHAEHHVETWVEELQVPQGADVRLYTVFPHMHLAGTDIKISIEREDEEVCLTHNPSWDFEWQLTYMYDGEFEALPRLEPGDTLRIRCTFNNSVSNPILAEYIDETDIAVTGVGEDTFDEMCTAILGVVY